jgi:PIN domain nuclease of toxin-antitoxin system
MDYVLDACALLAYLKKEPEAVKVKELFDKADTQPDETVIHISIVNLVEVYYGFIQENSEALRPGWVSGSTPLKTGPGVCFRAS